jgi:hypothetical protein
MSLNSRIIKQVGGDVRFWLALLFVLRLYNITQPPVEKMHSWRQITGVMVARNYLEECNNFFFPRRDWNDGGTGIIGMEFPVLNYLHYLTAELFGYQHWYGRLINLMVTTAGLWFFFRLVRDVTGRRPALFATILLACSLWFVFARKIMPDTFSLSITLIGLYYGCQYLWYGGARNALAYGLIGALGVLCKIPALVLLAGPAPLILKASLPLQRRLVYTGLSLGVAAIVASWYFGWNMYLSATYQTTYNSGVGLLEGFHDILTHPRKVANSFYFDAMKFSGFALFLGSVGWAMRRRRTELLWPLGATALLMIGFMGKSGFMFYHHNYYVLTFVPIMALFAGWGAAQVSSRWLGVVVVFVVVAENIINLQHDFHRRPDQDYLLKLETWANQFSQRGDLIAVNGAQNPQQMYFAHREGWVPDDRTIVRKSYLQTIAAEGCQYALINKRRLSQQQQEHMQALPYPVVFDNSYYRAYRLPASGSNS